MSTKHARCKRCGGVLFRLPRLALYECDTCGRADTLHELRAHPGEPPRRLTFRQEFDTALPGPYPRVTWSGN